jgi:hypothetical protein
MSSGELSGGSNSGMSGGMSGELSDDQWRAQHEADGTWEDESPRIIEEIQSGRRPAPPPRPKGSKPIIGWKPEDEERGEEGGQNERSDSAVSAPAKAPWRSPLTNADAFGPTGPEDAWMWEGVPPGTGLVGTPQPGKMRWYMDRDEHGPKYGSLPGAWPPGQQPEEKEA